MISANALLPLPLLPIIATKSVFWDMLQPCNHVSAPTFSAATFSMVMLLDIKCFILLHEVKLRGDKPNIRPFLPGF